MDMNAARNAIETTFTGLAGGYLSWESALEVHKQIQAYAPEIQKILGHYGLPVAEIGVPGAIFLSGMALTGLVIEDLAKQYRLKLTTEKECGTSANRVLSPPNVA